MPSARVGVVQLGSQETSNDIDASAPAASLLPVVPAADVEQLRDGELASATSHLSEDELAAKKLEESRRRAADSSTHGNVSLQGAGKAVAQMNGAVNGMATLKQKLAERIQAEFDNFSLDGALPQNLVVLIGIGLFVAFWGAFILQFHRFNINCSTDNGCKSSAIVPSDESGPLTVCVPTVAPILTISAGCMSFTVANNYSKIDKCIGEKAFQKEKWGAYWVPTGDKTKDEFHKSLAAHQRIWKCFKQDTNAKIAGAGANPTFDKLQDPDVPCIKQWTAKYHAGINDKLFTYRVPNPKPQGYPLASAKAGSLYTRVSDAGHKDLAVKLFSSLFTMSAALKSAKTKEAEQAKEQGRSADMWSESTNGTVALKMCGCSVASIAGHVGSADPMLNAANNNLNTFRLYIPANYIAVASLWLQDPATGAAGLSEWTGAIPSEAYYNANNQYPAWQNESWQKRALPKDDVYTVELVRAFQQGTQDEGEKGTQYAVSTTGSISETVQSGDCPAGSRCTVSGLGANTRHCSTATVFGGASTLFNNGLYFCVTELSGSSKFVEIFAYAEFCLWVGVYAVTGIVLPLVGLKAFLCKTLHNA